MIKNKTISVEKTVYRVNIWKIIIIIIIIIIITMIIP